MTSRSARGQWVNNNLVRRKQCYHGRAISTYPVWYLVKRMMRMIYIHRLCALDYTLYIDGSVQYYSNSIAIALELLQSCTKPSILLTHLVLKPEYPGYSGFSTRCVNNIWARQIRRSVSWLLVFWLLASYPSWDWNPQPSYPCQILYHLI